MTPNLTDFRKLYKGTGPQPIRGFGFALIIGSIGGIVFLLLDLPLPFILGAMTFCLAAAILRIPVSTPSEARPPMSAVIGVMLGSSYTPEMIGAVGAWLVPALGLIAFLFAAAMTCIAYFILVARFDFKTAYFAGMPGGLLEMVLLGDQYGANTRTIALVHSARVLIVVFSLPFLIRLFTDIEIDAVAAVGGQITFDPWSYVWLSATALAGVALGHILRLPAKYLLGPMAVSALLHSTGITDFAPPGEIVVAAQIVIGASIGCRFSGTRPSEILKIILLSLGSTILLLAITLAFAFGISSMSSYAITDLILAYSPGGLAEMGLIALSLNLEIAFVTSFHILRVLIVTLGASIIARFGLFRP